MKDALVFDIETIPYRWDAFKAKHPHTKRKPGLHGLISQIVAIGVHDGISPQVICEDNEEDLIRWFRGILHEHKTSCLVGYNVREFDIPMLLFRGMKYRIKLDFPDKRSQRIIDIMDSSPIGGKWQQSTLCSLDDLAEHLYGNGKETSGADVAKMWDAGDIESIRAHCMEDILITRKIFDEFKGVYW